MSHPALTEAQQQWAQRRAQQQRRQRRQTIITWGLWGLAAAIMVVCVIVGYRTGGLALAVAYIALAVGITALAGGRR